MIFWLLLALFALKNMDAVKRQHGYHLEIEAPWENSINLTVIFQIAFQQMAQWCVSDVSKCTVYEHVV